MRNYAQLLRNNPDYTRLWLAQVISLLGDWFDTITLLALVAIYSPEYKGLAVSGLLLARYIPAMVLSPFTGVLIDRFDRKRLMIWSNWLRALVVLGLVLTTREMVLLPANPLFLFMKTSYEGFGTGGELQSNALSRIEVFSARGIFAVRFTVICI